MSPVASPVVDGIDTSSSAKVLSAVSTSSAEHYFSVGDIVKSASATVSSAEYSMVSVPVPPLRVSSLSSSPAPYLKVSLSPTINRVIASRRCGAAPAPASTMSLPAPASMMSAPAPATMESIPAAAVIESAPSPEVMVSLPAAASIVSLPAPVTKVSAAVPLVTLSAPEPVVMETAVLPPVAVREIAPVAAEPSTVTISLSRPATMVKD